MRVLARVSTAWAFGLLLSAAPAAKAAPRVITEKDLLAFEWVADPRISPDGGSVAYVLVTVDEKEDRYDTSIWVVPASGSGEPTQGGEAMFRALRAQKKIAVMVRFPGETHELSRSGKPSHRVERLQHIVNWFEKYLKGEPTDLYDLR
jgi:dipeptidyl aminopeptidase/acylaminoacyl peptidase